MPRYERVEHHPVLGQSDAIEEIAFFFEDQVMTARLGDVIATALLASGTHSWRESRHEGQSRGIYCGIGHCFECQVIVDGRTGVRACLTPVRAGMRVEKMRHVPSEQGHSS